MQGFNGFEQLVEPLKNHRGVITVCHSFFRFMNITCNSILLNDLAIHEQVFASFVVWIFWDDDSEDTLCQWFKHSLFKH